MTNNTNRIGNFTSSEIVALTSEGKTKGTFSKPALTYIDETNFERLLGRSISDEQTAKPLTWGKLLEGRVFDLLGLQYILSSQDTIVHPDIDFWAGSPDGKTADGETVIDIKCPITLKSFCQLVKPLCMGLSGEVAMKHIRDNHKDGEKYFWQLVSNSILEKTKYAELIVYMPYKSELEEIKALAQSVPSDMLSKYYWIAMAQDGELPYINDNGYYKNINIIRFEVHQEYRDWLTMKVQEAGKMLINLTQEEIANVAIASRDNSLQATIIQEA